MNSRERVLSAFERRGYDRIPIKHEGTPEVNRMIMDHFGITNMEQLLRVVGDFVVSSSLLKRWRAARLG